MSPFLPEPDLGVAPLVAGKYRLVRRLGVGGMGAVWAARNDATGAEVALKVLLASDASEDLVERLRREAYATARLSHRSIVRVYDLIDFGEAGDQVAIVMELLHGRTLADHLKDRGKLPLEEVVAIALPILGAVEHAHRHGVVHRDLKPENVFLAVDPDGIVTPKILDFGISKLRVAPRRPAITQDGELLGTPSYMSPEQVRGTDLDGRSDLFNVGILLYEMLTGHNPFLGHGLHGILLSILEEEPKRVAGVPTAVWRVIERALQKDPERRFASADELATALRRAIAAPKRSSRAPSAAPPRRWPIVASAVGMFVVAATVAAAFAASTVGVASRTAASSPASPVQAQLIVRHPGF